MRMTAICSRVMGSFGANVVSFTPLTMPFSAAQMTAFVYQLFFSTSRNGAVPLTEGSPAMRYSTVTSMARLISPSGEKVIVSVPTMRSLRVT